MNTRLRLRIWLPLVALVMAFVANVAAAQEPKRQRILESFPPRIQARLENRDRFLRELPRINGHAPRALIERLKCWTPGSTITVAFEGGAADLHRDIARAANKWAAHGNFKLDFGHNPQTGAYRSWKASDNTYTAQIRISFRAEDAYSGYWSFVGHDSVNSTVVRPGEPSMNLESFDVARPADWEAVVLHEFGHALGFHHEHQQPVGGCDSEFRWENDPDYIPTQDQHKQYIPDANGKRPGVYTVLAGAPNFWSEAIVNHNLRQLADSDAYLKTPFDPKSIMKYSFDAWMFTRGQDSHCFTLPNTELSDMDKQGCTMAYPTTPADLQATIAERKDLLQQLVKQPKLQQATKQVLEAELQKIPQ
jgi:hypothetical protein